MSKPLNYQTLFEIDVNPSGTAKYVRLGEGFTTPTINNNEKVDQTAYLNGEGGSSTEVTGFQHTVKLAGFYDPSNEAHQFLRSIWFSMGSGRHTNARITDPQGQVKTGDVTIRDIVIGGGDANAKQTLEFQMDFNGLPTVTDPATATAMAATIAAGTASGTTKATWTKGTDNKTYYGLSSASLSLKGRSYVDVAALHAYTTGADIAATVGQYLNLYEVDAYNHLVFFESHVLASGDIAS